MIQRFFFLGVFVKFYLTPSFSLPLSVLINQVDETVEPEEGWLYGSRQGLMGWFPKSYVERVAQSELTTPAPPVKLPIQSQLSNALEAAKAAGTKSAFTPTHSPNLTHSDTQGQVRHFCPIPTEQHILFQFLWLGFLGFLCKKWTGKIS